MHRNADFFSRLANITDAEVKVMSDWLSTIK
jgi:hypothetical protein